ncbi:MAG TPA: glycine cleavage system aminomethyltransferase GcvT [Terriglobia bacterium]|nr:glycine cleavage system aminomethyltransferase GcvT [Terriglobia bacterium]
METTTQLKKTALHGIHKELGARLAEFAGWEMPIEYCDSGIIQEHMAVRTAAGLFDISHMGEIEITGPESLALVQLVTSNDASRLQDGQIQYSGLLYPEGTFVDDILVHRITQYHYFLCVNASNAEKDFEWINQQNRFDAKVEDTSRHYTQLALQGPQALAILRQLTHVNLEGMKYYWFAKGQVDGIDALITRTGYTGEDGFELYFSPDYSKQIWKSLFEVGSLAGLLPVGLGARNTLRLEAKMALYGHEISEKTTPWEAGLDWIVKPGKGEFIGKAALLAQKQRGISRKLVGLEMQCKGIARDGYPVLIAGEVVGTVTSGSLSPFLKKNIGLAYVPAQHSEIGTVLDIQVRNQRLPAKVVATPFYTRRK